MKTIKNSRAPHKKATIKYSKAIGLEPQNTRAVEFGYAKIVYCDVNRCWVLPDGKNQQKRYVRSIHAAYRFAKKMHAMIMENGANRIKSIPFVHGEADE